MSLQRFPLADADVRRFPAWLTRYEYLSTLIGLEAPNLLPRCLTTYLSRCVLHTDSTHVLNSSYRNVGDAGSGGNGGEAFPYTLARKVFVRRLGVDLPSQSAVGTAASHICTAYVICHSGYQRVLNEIPNQTQ